jgi:D-alanyl-D-alanine carboxypeptidase
MFAHRHVKPRFQLDTPQPPQRTTTHAPQRSLLPIKVAIKPRHKKRRFRVGATDASPWNMFPFQVTVERKRSRRRITLTLAQRRQLRRLGVIFGSLCALIAVIVGALLLIPSTRAALFPQASHASAPSAPLTASGPYGASNQALHYGASLPFTTLQTHVSASGAPAPSIQAESAFVFDPERGWILYQKNADTSYPAASLTKVMTLLVAIDSAPLDQEVTIGPDAAALVNSNNSYMGVSAGERLTMRELLYGLIVSGGNDAALAIADAVAGNKASFVAMMNVRARQLGLTHTHFVTPDGVDANDVTSASDMAKLSALAIMRPGVEQITSTFQYVIPQTATHKLFNLQGGNDLLPGGGSPYPGANGVKTGYTAEAQYCMAFSARSQGHLIVGVILGDPSAQARVADAHALLDWGFAQG